MPPVSKPNELVNDDQPSVSKNSKPKRKQRRKKKTQFPTKRDQLNLNFKIKFKKILRRLHDELRLTANSVCILNSFINDIFERITDQAIHFQKVSKRKNLTHLDIAAACKVLLPGTLQSQAIMEATRAVVLYRGNKINYDQKNKN